MANSKTPVIVIPEDEEDVEFIYQLEAAEAEALSLSSSKRRRIDADSTARSKIQKAVSVELIKEGAYTAALKGSKSLTWQKQQQSGLTRSTSQSLVGTTTAGGGGGGSGACFKCGKEGHWARECPKMASSAVNLGAGTPPSAVIGAEKVCPCGSGTCLLLTANTERNRGRKFIRCPIRQENGGCGFFEWCDETSENIASPKASAEKAWKNGVQQQFYQSPTNQAASGFTKSWNDYDNGTSAPNFSYGQRFETTDNKSYGIKSGSSASSCFKCGQDGHWAKDCLTASSNVAAGARGSQTSGTCFKCGQAGHWARDCSQSQGQSTKLHNW